jgi:hypothetical protein
MRAGTHMFASMHVHACRAVPVTSFLGDSAQLDSHTSSPRERAAAGEENQRRELLGRQEVHRVAAGTGCSACRGRKAGEGRGVISWPGMAAGRGPV